MTKILVCGSVHLVVPNLSRIFITVRLNVVFPNINLYCMIFIRFSGKLHNKERQHLHNNDMSKDTFDTQRKTYFNKLAKVLCFQWFGRISTHHCYESSLGTLNSCSLMLAVLLSGIINIKSQCTTLIQQLLKPYGLNYCFVL